MRVFYFLLFFIPVLVESKTLFIGNSLTARNCLPCMYKRIYQTSTRRKISTFRSTKGGYTLRAHLYYRKTHRALKRRRYGAVVLQEQSTLIKDPEYDVVAIRSIMRRHRNVYLIETWAHTGKYFKDEELLRSNFKRVVGKTGVGLVPVGIYWTYIKIFLPDLGYKLTTDDIHPSKHGTYLAACLTVKSIHNIHVSYRYRPKGISYRYHRLLTDICNMN